MIRLNRPCDCFRKLRKKILRSMRKGLCKIDTDCSAQCTDLEHDDTWLEVHGPVFSLLIKDNRDDVECYLYRNGSSANEYQMSFLRDCLDSPYHVVNPSYYDPELEAVAVEIADSGIADVDKLRSLLWK